jgi:serine/threonine protein phosphatase PrpC
MPTRVTACGQTDTGIVRSHNEDAFLIADLAGGDLGAAISRFEVGNRGVLLAVSDGMGGHQAGEVASALVLESLERSMAGQAVSEPPDALMEKATARANRDVWEAAHHPGREHMGATLEAVFIRDTVAHIATVGDSRAYLVRNGIIQQVSHDQSYVQFLLDTGAMTPAEAKRSEHRNVILQAMGLKPDVKVALGRLELRQRDCFLVCSDGLSNKVTDEELRDLVLTSSKVAEAAAKMIALANQRGGEDNITVIVAGVSGDLLPLVAGERISRTWQVLKEFDVAARA